MLKPSKDLFAEWEQMDRHGYYKVVGKNGARMGNIQKVMGTWAFYVRTMVLKENELEIIGGWLKELREKS